MVAVEALSSMWPCQPGGRPKRSATQSSTTPSNSVAAGAVRHRKATVLSVAASISPRIAVSDEVVAK